MIRAALRSGIALAMLAQAGIAQAQAVAAPADGTAPAIAALLAQARYWQDKGQANQSLSALRQILKLDPGNADALALKAKIELAQGDIIAGQQDLATLQQVQPASPDIASLQAMQSAAANPVDTGLLAQARQAAKDQQYAQAASLYRQSFHGDTPPSAYSSEYYQTLAGTSSGYGEAISGLGQLVAGDPDNLQNQLAFATTETYQPALREAGIKRLASLAGYPAVAQQAKAAWAQALGYLPANSDSVPLFQQYLAQYPNDQTVQGMLATALTPPVLTPAQTEAQNRAKGFDALNDGQLGTAAALFQAALAADPNDADALGGLGLVKLRQGNTQTATSLLKQAIAANPAEAAQWQNALSGAARGADYAAASAALNAGRFSEAERLLQGIIAAGGNVTGAEEMLADAQTRQGDYASAGSSWRAVLARDPGNAPAMIGLGTVLAHQGDQQGAQQLFQQAAANGSPAEAQQAQAALLLSQAQAAGSPQAALPLYQAAVAAAPDDPWARLHLANALRLAGRGAEAQQQMDDLVSGPNPSVADLQAAALFANESGRPSDAAALVARLPPAAMTPDMRAIAGQAQLAQQIANAQAQSAGNPMLLRQLLVGMAAAPDPDGSRGAAIAAALSQAGDAAGAQLAIDAASAANPAASNKALITYAGTLLANGQDAATAQMVQTIQARGVLSADDQASLASLRTGLAVRASDRLAGQGRLADAYAQLAPGLAQTPADPSLNEALARLYSANHQAQQALAIYQVLLQQNPGDLDARAGAVDAAIAARDWNDAETLVQNGELALPGEPRIWMMAADIAKARGHDREALADLQTAQQLRTQQLAAQSGAAGAVQLASSMPVAANPFGTPAAGGAVVPAILTPGISGMSTAGLYNAAPTDPLSAQITGQIAGLQQTQVPTIQAGLAVESRSGSGGLDQLETIQAPITGTYSPGGMGTLTLTATPTFLTAGQLDGDATIQTKFGSDALGVATPPNSQSATGIGVGAAYALPWLKLSVGSTPIGFHAENVIGSAELDPVLPNGLGFSIKAERAPMTDSLLSYAATRDPRTGMFYGGVLRDRVTAQVSVSAGAGYAYAGGGVAQLTGQHVARNNEVEFNAGGAYPIEQGDDSTTNLGVNVTYFRFAKNLRYFTLGQGGYFSPQSYFAATLPIDYSETDGDWTWAIGGSLGLQSYSEDRSPYFPINPDLQGQLIYAAANSTNPAVNLQAYYPSDTNSGIIGGVHGRFEYRLNDKIVLGGTLNYNRSGNWNDTQAMLFARYLLNGQ